MSGSIAGAVTAADTGLLPVAGTIVTITVVAAAGAQSSYAAVDASGHYTVTGLRAGRYYVRASAFSSDDLLRWRVRRLWAGGTRPLLLQVVPFSDRDGDVRAADGTITLPHIERKVIRAEEAPIGGQPLEDGTAVLGSDT